MNENIESVRDVLKDILERRYKNTPPAVIDHFNDVAFGIRYLITKNDISDVWGKIRSSDRLSDFVLDVTREFLLRAFNNSYTYENLCYDIAETLSCIGSVNSSIDDDLISSILKAPQVNAVFGCNPWYTVLYLTESITALEIKDV